MMTSKDWISFLIGAIILALGLLPMIYSNSAEKSFLSLSFIPETFFPWILAIGGLYLIINAFIEITNSNIMGWISLLVGALILGFGLLPFLKGLLNSTMTHILLIIDGFFLMIAAFAMEL